MKKLVLINLIVAVLSIFLLTGTAIADMTGEQLAKRIYDRDIGKDSNAVSSMKLINKKGKERVRNFTIRTRKDENGLIRQMIKFQTPADIMDTGFLSIEREGGKTDQSMYLPALRRIWRVGLSNKGGSFVNTNFTYEDMERRPVKNDEHEIVGEATKGDADCYILESRPKKEAKSQYSLIKNWIDKNSYVPVYTELYDKKGKLIKIYRAVKLEKIDGIWTIVEATMKNLNKKTKTIIKVNSIKYNLGLHPKFFTKRYLGKTGR
ncbi:outer membrane lipoprotein-sorting protein [Candidatus Parcubacteria bacterium]|nr:outer membrane lipoprotein-sorting protein [Candidatus Parcubacteria bacterium]